MHVTKVEEIHVHVNFKQMCLLSGIFEDLLEPFNYSQVVSWIWSEEAIKAVYVHVHYQCTKLIIPAPRVPTKIPTVLASLAFCTKKYLKVFAI